MYTVQKVPFGFKVTAGDRVTPEEAQRVLVQSRGLLRDCVKPFGVLVDIRTLWPLADDVQKFVDETQRLFRRSGLGRSAVILDSAVLTMQFMRLAKDSGVYAHERYIDASKHEDWERLAREWIVSAVDPDLPRSPTSSRIPPSR